jgi:GNAT superfamily N-acetyltransferase
MEITIRTATVDDAAALGEILRSVDWFTSLIEMPAEELQASILQSLESCLADSSHLLLVAETGTGSLAGYLSLHWLPYLFLDGAEGYISELFVHKAIRSAGVGTLLIERAKEEGRARGCSRLMLVNGRTRESYQRDFYKKNGWHERETMANFVYDLKE